jgi:hypothetical protein
MRAHAKNNSEKAARTFGRFDLDPNAVPTDAQELLV